MSLYNMIFGQNERSDAILATLGLTTGDVGRFRNCYVADGEIAVYTRNGGGNRECWHAERPHHGSKSCVHVVTPIEVDEWAFMPKSEWPDGKPPGFVFTSRDGVSGCEYKTGRRVVEDHFVCQFPSSADCACPGCTIEHRLPKHHLYLRDEDDDFDSTYATIYFRIPDEFRDELMSMNLPDFKPSDLWIKAIEALKTT